MLTLSWGALTTAAALALHVLLWKIRPPRRQTRALLLIFLGAVAGFVTLALAAPEAWPAAWLRPPQDAPTLARVVLFTAAMALSYVITYSAIEADSPTLLLVSAIDRAGDRGLPREELSALLNDDVLIRTRLRDLVRDGLAAKSPARYELTPKGRAFVRVFIIQRDIMGLGKGG